MVVSNYNTSSSNEESQGAGDFWYIQKFTGHKHTSISSLRFMWKLSCEAMAKYEHQIMPQFTNFDSVILMMVRSSEKRLSKLLFK